MAMPALGSKAPDFTLLDSYSEKVSLAALLGKWVVLYFYPKDDTPGCTTEALEFTLLKDEFASLNAVVLGISKDSCQSHEKFVLKHHLGITLLSDPDNAVIEAYGAWGPKKMYGKEFMGITRSTVLIDPTGKIAACWDKVKAGGHAQEVLSALRQQQG